MRLLLCILCLTCITTVHAQKPVTARPFEIKLPAENENWTISGNIRYSQQTNHPAAVYGAYFKVSNGTPESMAREYLALHKNLFGFSEADLQNLRLHAIRQDEAGTTVRLRQTWKSLPVNKNAEVTIHISTGNIVDFVMNGFVYGISMQDVNPVVNAASARQQVADRISLNSAVTAESNTLMVLHHGNKDYLVYRVSMAATDPLGEWEAYIDAKTGIMLQLTDAGFYHHSKKKTILPAGPWAYKPFVLVNGTGNVFDPDPLTTAHAAYGGSYVDGADANAAVLTAQLQSVSLLDITLNAGTYSLVGPYAEIRDFEAPAKGLFTQASSVFAFDRNADAFEAVNTYYLIDQSMRYLNTTLGISVMPYQYAGGVRFDPSGLSGADNSHYLGGSGSLAFGEGGVDDAEDADVVIHELGHGIHDWITAGGLSQVNGLSEGSGDYWAGSYSRFKGGWLVADAAYNWTFNWDGHNPFWAGRVLNYAAVYPAGLVGQIHTDGQIWATANMKIWDDIGRQKADKAFWRGLALTNAASSQNDAANAVFQAAINMNYSNADRQKIYNRYTAAGYTLPPFIVLPTTLVNFNAQKAGDHTRLSWVTSSESGSKTFTVERSADGMLFSAIGEKPAAGNSTVTLDYALNDLKPLPGINYYRLRQTDIDGKFSFSPVVAVSFDHIKNISIFPNPVTDKLNLKTSIASGIVYIYDVNGRQVLIQPVSGTNSSNGNISITVSHLADGVYMLKLVAAGQEMKSQFIKRK